MSNILISGCESTFFHRSTKYEKPKATTHFKGAPIFASDTKSAVQYLFDRESPLSVSQMSLLLKLPEQTAYSAIRQLDKEDKISGTRGRSTKLPSICLRDLCVSRASVSELRDEEHETPYIRIEIRECEGSKKQGG